MSEKKGHTIAYDVKSCEVNMTIVNRTEVWLKGLKISTANRRDIGIASMYMMWL